MTNGDTYSLYQEGTSHIVTCGRAVDDINEMFLKLAVVRISPNPNLHNKPFNKKEFQVYFWKNQTNYLINYHFCFFSYLISLAILMIVSIQLSLKQRIPQIQLGLLHVLTYTPKLTVKNNDYLNINQIRLIRSPKKFIFRYQDIVEIYSVSAEKIINDGFSYSENV